MAITQNGNSFTWTGTVTVTNATDLTTGVATLVLTPSGGIGNLPFLAQGASGLPPVFDNVNVSTLTSGSAATASWTTNSSGGAGTASHYTLNLGIPAGPAGYSLNATQTITLTGTVTGGTFTLGYAGQTTGSIAYNASAATIQTALTGLGNIGSGNATVTGSGPWVVAFSSSLGSISTLKAVSSLTGTTPGVSVQGNYTIGGAADLDTTTNPLQDQFTIKYQSSSGNFRYAAQLCGPTFQGTVSSYSGNNSLQQLSSISVPAQLFSWVPNCSALVYSSGTANTHVDLAAVVCSVSNGTTLATGQQVGYGGGVTGSGSGTIPPYPITLNQAIGGNFGGGYGIVPAGTSATIYLAAKQTAATTDAYSVTGTGSYFTVHIDPIPGTN